MRIKRFVWATAAIVLTAALASCNIGKAPEPTPDVNAIFTSAAQTMIAGLSVQQTETAKAGPPTAKVTRTPQATFTALPTFPIGTGSVPFGTTPFTFTTPFTLTTPGTALTPIPTTRPVGTGSFSGPVGCDDAMFVGETKPLDGTRVDSGSQFKKGWSMQNVGTCTWDVGYSFAFKDGDQLHGDDQRVVNSDQSTKPGHSQAWVVTFTAPFKPGEYKSYWQMKNASGVWFGSIVYVDIVVK